MQLTDLVRERLRAAADEKFGEGQRRFFQHEVNTYGVRGPELKAIARNISREVKTRPLAARNDLCTEFWKSGKLAGLLHLPAFRAELW